MVRPLLVLFAFSADFPPLPVVYHHEDILPDFHLNWHLSRVGKQRLIRYVMAGSADPLYSSIVKPSIPDTGTVISLEGEHAVVRMKHEGSCSKCGAAAMGLCNAGLMQVPPDDS